MLSGYSLYFPAHSLTALDHEAAVESVYGNEFIVRTLLDDFAVIDDEDTVSIAYGLESVRYHNDGLVMGQLCDCLHQLFLILGVDIRRRLIEDDYGRVLHNCPRDGDALALACLLYTSDAADEL